MIDFEKNKELFFDSARAKRLFMRKEKFNALVHVLGRETAYALDDLYSLYDEDIYIWLSELYQPNVGGFYYSNSARDTEGFLPDIESTAQAFVLCKTTGLFRALPEGNPKNLPEKIRKEITAFTKSLQDPESGYFYHPQWGKGVNHARRGRDLRWALNVLDDLGESADYPTALDHLEKKDNMTVLQEHLRSPEAFREYLLSFEGKKWTSYQYGNALASQSSEILAAGEKFAEVVFEYLDSKRNPENGLWEKNVDYASVNGSMALTKLYTGLNKPLPYAEKAFGSAMYVAMDDEIPTFVCQFYNPWLTMSRILDNLTKFGEEETAKRLREKVRNVAPRLLDVAAERIKMFKKDDGSFSYFTKCTSDKSQGMPVAVAETNEGDVNATAIATCGVLMNIASTLGIELPPVFCVDDSEIFLKTLELSVPKEKKYHNS